MEGKVKIHKFVNEFFGIQSNLKQVYLSEEEKDKKMFFTIMVMLEKQVGIEHRIYDDFAIDLLTYGDTYWVAINTLLIDKYGLQPANLLNWYLYESKSYDGKVIELDYQIGDNQQKAVIATINELWEFLQIIPEDFKVGWDW